VVHFNYEDIPMPRVGEWAVLLGYWVNDGIFEVECANFELDESVATATRLLFVISASGRWPKTLVGKVLKHLEDSTLEPVKYLSNVVVADPNLSEFMTEKQILSLVRGWRLHFFRRQLELMSLNGEEIRELLADHHRDTQLVYRKVRRNPYPLLSLSLLRCEFLIKRFPWFYPNPLNRTAGEIARFLRSRLLEFHHTFVSLVELRKIFPNLELHLKELCGEDYGCHLTEESLYLRQAYEAEQTVISTLTRLSKLPPSPPPDGINSKVPYSEEQLQALNGLVTQHICILQGGAGTGKTTLISEVAKQFESRGLKTLISSFTGKAVRVLRGKTGFINISTLHQALVGEPEKDDTLQALIIDEVSMCPLSLLARIFRRFPSLQHLALVGDVNQLPPIDWCGFMDTLLKSSLPIYQLSINHRTLVSEDGTNAILANAHRIIQDKTLMVSLEAGSNLWWFDGGIFEIKELLVELSKKYSGTDVTIIVPYRYLASELNIHCQEIFNRPGRKEYKDGKGICWRLGDRVILCKNFNKLGINNGDEGVICNVTDKAVRVSFDAGEFDFLLSTPFHSNLEDEDETEDAPELRLGYLQHSWAVTCHKSQGSEWEVVIIYIPHFSNFITRELMYVAMTRAMKKLFIFADGVTVYNSLNNLSPKAKCHLQI
jgi:hypothetical protein